MTVQELRDILTWYDPTDLVTINTLGFHRGVFPIGDETHAAHMDPAPDGETYHCLVLAPSNWP